MKCNLNFNVKLNFFSECSFTKHIRPGSSLIMRSPNWPGLYPHNLRCKITLYTNAFSTIQTSSGLIYAANKLYFSSNHFDIESHTNCNYDYFRVDSRKYCGTFRTPLGILSKTSSVNVLFHTDNSYERTGYLFRVTAVNRGEECSFILSSFLRFNFLSIAFFTYCTFITLCVSIDLSSLIFPYHDTIMN